MLNVYNSYNEFLQSKTDYGIFLTDNSIDLDNWSHFQVKNTFIYFKHKQPIDVTFIIQGLPKEETFIKLICSLLRVGYVHLSIWNRDTLNLDEVTNFVKQNGIQNGQNIYLQVHSTLFGLIQCKTHYAIKVRADEWYDDFSEFILSMKKHPNKITTHTMFFRTISQYPYHISDHVIGGTKENLLKMFNNAKYMLETKEHLPKIPRMLPHCPEQWLTVAYMRNFYSQDELKDNIKEKMITHFHIVPIGIFKDFFLTYTWQKKRCHVLGVKDLKNHSHAFAIVDINKIA